jgi:hypothetical protein
VNMVAYKLYGFNKTEEAYLIGILPERRGNQERIRQDSILKWGKEVIGDHSDIHNIYFIQTAM